MKTYWDLTKKERVALTDEELAHFERVELMTCGVLDVPTLLTEPTQDVPEPDLQAFEVELGYHSRTAFRDIEQARRFLDDLMPFALEHEYVGGEVVGREGKIKRPEIKPVTVYSAMMWAKHGEAIQENRRIHERNAEREKKRTEALKDRDKALTHLRQDHAEHRRDAHEHETIYGAFESYVKLTEGDQTIAMRFLEKAYSRSKIVEAFAWRGLTAPTSDMPAEFVEAKPDPAPASDDLQF